MLCGILITQWRDHFGHQTLVESIRSFNNKNVQEDDKPPVENLLPRGFISTNATDENSLKIYFIHESQERTFNSDILVLQEFAAAWSSGERVTPNETCWAAGFARACIHVYSENEDETPGYQGWRRVSKTNNYFKELKITDDLAKAKCHDLASYIDAEEISETPGPSGM
ncbi:hypothetical protein E4U56_001266 [Claviceps arundinis]|uniref:Uncharacterized protein n=1 Tax=Claviceps arundinis TaxID=1623583 RepID=A0A9P7MSS6_9HYPO|nr:hypothetical protein E4U56_001266 [Claviceps arundinis]